jgi:hypothetical protein
MNDFGIQSPQQYAPAGARRQAGPPPRPPMPGMAPGHPAPPVRHFSAQQFPAQQQPGRPGVAPQPYGQQRPVQQPIPAQRRPIPPQPGPGAWPPPQGPAAAPPAPPMDDPNAVPVRKRGKLGKVIGTLVVVAALGGVGWVVASGGTAPVTAAAGDCVKQTGENDVAVVACGDPSAQFKVAGKLENKTVIDASLFACADFPEATSSYWQGVEGKPGTVLCLAPVTPAAPAS